VEGLETIEGQASWFRVGKLPRISYYAAGIMASCNDFIIIAVSSVIIDFLYNIFFYDSSNHSNYSLEDGIVVAAIFVSFGKTLSIYKLTYLLSPTKYLSRILIVWVMSILLVTAVLFLLRAGAAFSRGSVIILAVTSPVLLILFKMLFARVLQSLIARGAISGRRAVIIGGDSELSWLSSPSLLIDFGLTELTRISIQDGSRSNGLTVEESARLDTAIAVAREQHAQELVIALNWSRAELIQNITDRLRILPLPVRLLPDLAVQSLFRSGNFSSSGSVPTVELQRTPLTRPERLIKRVCDAVFALAALVLLAPLMLLTALVIKLDSVGPIIFRQRRTGFNGRVFSIYKFRTMFVTEDGPQITQTRRVDPRVTKVGRLLRQSSIDELPQLFNVLRGDMSLVGPRPHALAHDDKCKAMISSYAYRHHVKPGITGWAQVNGLRGETRQIGDMEKRVELDLWYINNWSLILDLRIIWRTCFELMRNKGY
jgi:Undecaprenyl-phosphate glucose phosphotransferase